MARDDIGVLARRVRALLEDLADRLPFHGWSHTDFVRRKAVEYARERDADVRVVEAAALVHDLNYVVARGSDPAAGRRRRASLLGECGFEPDEIGHIERVVEGAHTAWRGRDVDPETACLSDADTLYKALPITPVLFSHRYLSENRLELGDLAKKIVGEQSGKLADDYYFYDAHLAQRYGPWAKVNLDLWSAVLESLDDPDVAKLVADAGSV